MLQRRDWRSGTTLLSFGFGGLIAAILLYFGQIAPDVATLTQVSGIRPLFTGWDAPMNALLHLLWFISYSPMEFLILCVALVAAFFRRHPADMHVLLLFLLLLLMLGFITAQDDPNYTRQLSPIIGLLLGTFLALGFGSSSQQMPFRRGAAIGALGVMLLLGYTLYTPSIYIRESGPLQREKLLGTDWIKENVPTDQKVLAPSPYYFELWEYPYTSTALPIAAIPHYDINQDEFDSLISEQGKELWEQVAPDVIVYNTDVPWPMSHPSLINPKFLSENNYELAAELSDENSRVRIYWR